MFQYLDRSQRHHPWKEKDERLRTDLDAVRSCVAKVLSLSSLNTKYAAASAAEASPAASDPGELSVILYSVLGVPMSSGRSQHWWSALPSPT
jgi:hypothetical protein